MSVIITIESWIALLHCCTRSSSTVPSAVIHSIFTVCQCRPGRLIRQTGVVKNAAVVMSVDSSVTPALSVSLYYSLWHCYRRIQLTWLGIPRFWCMSNVLDATIAITILSVCLSLTPASHAWTVLSMTKGQSNLVKAALNAPHTLHALDSITVAVPKIIM